MTDAVLSLVLGTCNKVHCHSYVEKFVRDVSFIRDIRSVPESIGRVSISTVRYHFT